MKIKLIATVLVMLAMLVGQSVAQQTGPEQTQPPKPKPVVRLTFAERMKQYLQRTGSTIDEAKSGPDMVVSNYPDAKGTKLTIVLVNDRRKNLLGFYIYNFGSLKAATNKEEVYRYLLSANDAITIGSFFVDSDDDIGYKYLVSGGQTMTQAAFESAYYTMAAVARERKPEIRKLLGAANEKEDRPSDVKKAAEEKPPSES
ncbi:MAG TPA: YbjN domain-containing protein [Blastocatellia bacterium]|nr:YbjN domain-containing protein [Blastocatellia bacterium]